MKNDGSEKVINNYIYKVINNYIYINILNWASVY